MAGISGKKWSRRKRVSFVRYMLETWQNKLVAIVLVIAGLVPVFMDGDATAFVLFMFFAVPLFFSRKNCMY